MSIIVGTNRDDLAHLIKQLLSEEFSDIITCTVDSSFLELLYKANPEIIILDIVNLKNWEKLVENICLAPSIREIPLIVIIKRKTSSIIKKLCEAEVHDYILDSFDKCEIIWKIKRSKEIVELKREFDKLLTRDPLTGVYNRGFLMERLYEEIRWCTLYKEPLSLALLDIDYFKKINDTYGHLTGDRVLMEIAYYCLQYLPNKVTLGRYGGEEFCLIMPSTDGQEAINICEELRKLIENNRFHSIKGEQIRITISIGVTTYLKDDDEAITADLLINKADIALYKAKQAGRNRVVFEDFMVE